MKSELVDVEGELVKPLETEFAYHFDHGGTKPVWLPKSQVEWHPKQAGSRLGTMVVPLWLAEEKGMI